MATTKETTAPAAAKQAPEANHHNETVSVTNSGNNAPVATPVESVTSTETVATEQAANIAPATEVDPSGAPVQIVPDVDLSHPAIDADPRKGTTVAQNRIDFNDPTLTPGEAVANMLRAQGVEVITDPSSK
ncbi:hypothetical protein [Rhizobium sp. Leaf306]|uniref:hypothetical protein n=1 Tax=Rhizobium sp. Leaf306 TaxID=1736330 RepID=UPI000B04227A|nr:hypothetical protein [Rhizobium sp. Leaf306]